MKLTRRDSCLSKVEALPALASCPKGKSCHPVTSQGTLRNVWRGSRRLSLGTTLEHHICMLIVTRSVLNELYKSRTTGTIMELWTMEFLPHPPKVQSMYSPKSIVLSPKSKIQCPYSDQIGIQSMSTTKLGVPSNWTVDYLHPRLVQSP